MHLLPVILHDEGYKGAPKASNSLGESHWGSHTVLKHSLGYTFCTALTKLYDGVENDRKLAHVGSHDRENVTLAEATLKKTRRHVDDKLLEFRVIVSACGYTTKKTNMHMPESSIGFGAELNESQKNTATGLCNDRYR